MSNSRPCPRPGLLQEVRAAEPRHQVVAPEAVEHVHSAIARQARRRTPTRAGSRSPAARLPRHPSRSRRGVETDADPSPATAGSRRYPTRRVPRQDIRAGKSGEPVIAPEAVQEVVAPAADEEVPVGVADAVVVVLGALQVLDRPGTRRPRHGDREVSPVWRSTLTLSSDADSRPCPIRSFTAGCPRRAARQARRCRPDR